MKRIITGIVTILAIAFCLSSVFSAGAITLPDAQVSLLCDYTQVDAGDNIKISLCFDNASAYKYGLAAFTSSLKYDRSAFVLENVEYAANKSDVMSNNQEGEFKTLYMFTSPTKEPGFNTDGVFYTAEFSVKSTAAGKYDFSVDFDAINIQIYRETSGVDNYKVGFNKPTVSLNVIGAETSSTASVASGVESTGSDATSSANTSAVQSSNTSSNVTSSKADNKIKSTNFKKVESSLNTESYGKDSYTSVVSVQSTASIAESTVSSATAIGTSKPAKADDSTGNPVKIIVIVVSVLVAAAAAVAVALVIKNKRKK